MVAHLRVRISQGGSPVTPNINTEGDTQSVVFAKGEQRNISRVAGNAEEG